MNNCREDNLQIQDDKQMILEEIKKIEELDASIHNLELQIKKGNEELSKERSKNREKLRNMLLSAPPESGLLSKNTTKFFNLHENGNIEDSQDNSEGILNMTDEEKRRIEDLINTQDFPDDQESSPYFINEDMKEILNKNCSDK